MARLSIANIMRVTILAALRGLADINTSALALFTDDEPVVSGYGTYRIYLDAAGVLTDFGSSSSTARLAEMIFSQNPNILTGGGYLVIIPQDQAADAQPAKIIGSGYFDLTTLTETDYIIRLAIDGASQNDIAIGTIDSTSLATVLTSLNNAAVTSAGLVFTISGDIAKAKITLSTIATGAAKELEIDLASTVAWSGTDLSPLVGLSGSATGAAAGVERVKDAILRTMDSIGYFGIIMNKKLSDAILTELSSFVQTLDKLLFVSSSTEADIIGVFKDLIDASYTHTRCLYYSVSANDSLDFSAGYASRGLSINFDGERTAMTMHLKEIVGLVADTGLDQTVLDSAYNTGVDIYADFGVPKLFTSGINSFFDAIYTALAFKLKLQISGFNVLATVSNKVAQTEEGMNILKKAARIICAKFVKNGCAAPGTWTSSTVFGDPEDHIRNITEQGYFVYSSPIALQSTTQREKRVALGIYIALKSSGAIHSADILCYIEA